MYSYIIGKIISKNKKTITFENNYTGYFASVAEDEEYEEGKVKKIYLYKNMSLGKNNKINEELYAFISYEKKELFLKLLNVQGIGPKTAIAICGNDTTLVNSLIQSKDIDALSSLKGVTPKVARNMVEDCVTDITASTAIEADKLIKALRSLGYTQRQVEIALMNINDSNRNLDLSDLISESIKYIASQSNELS
ncbi:MAG: hypothetical protein LBM76_00210 [Mycoplasmataceae bacterium]|jgi:Holliday junction DNA helicase RuvA|nr:hypothetical protein [Mycoplasmataceae bacterium]